MTFKATTLEVFTVGHSTLSYERFIALLRHAGVNAVADVRTSPFSRHFPQFNRDTLKSELRLDGCPMYSSARSLAVGPAIECSTGTGWPITKKWQPVRALAKA
jgi:Protein of unknown function, DUF488